MQRFALIVVLCYFLYGISGDIDTTVCDSSKCYQNVNNSLINLTDLIDRLNSTASSANVTKPYDLKNLTDDVRDLRNIRSESRRIKSTLDTYLKEVNQTEKNILNDQETVDKIFEKLSRYYNSSGGNILSQARRNHTELQNLYTFAKNVSDTCQQRRNSLSEFENILVNLTQNFNSATKRANKLNKNLNKTFQETVTSKKKFDELELPSNLVGNYIAQVENNTNNTLRHLKDNTDLLKEILGASQKRFNDYVNKSAEEVINSITATQKDVDQMNKDLTKYEQAINRILTNESKEGVITETEIDFCDQTNLVDLKSKAEVFGNELPDRAVEFCEKRKHLRQILKENNLLLDYLPGPKQLKNFEIHMKQLRYTVYLLEELETLRSERDRLRKNRDEISNVNCSADNSGLIA